MNQNKTIGQQAAGDLGDMLDVAIIGAGIGGAAAAVALRRAGLWAEVYEQAAELREVGGAIVIRERSMELFRRWGLAADLLPRAVEVMQIELRAKDGQIMGQMPTAVEADEPVWCYPVHRADVHGALLGQLPAGMVHLSHRLAEISDHEGYAQATFENGVRVRARLIVGADGLRSVVRRLIDDTPMNFVGMVTHRTIAPASVLPADMPNDRLRLWRSAELAVLTLPIRGGAELAIDAVIPTPEAPAQLWSSASADELLALYADFDPVIGAIVQARISPITTHPVYDKDPISQWSRGRVVLLGDAAHPMAPMQGQGANQAIQDGDALAEALTANPNDLKAALAEYQARRAPVTAAIQTLSRRPPAAARMGSMTGR